MLMPLIRLPSEQDVSYPPARGPVLLLSCMDLRLLDEVVQFMDHDGLTNRYDHVILAGAALGALGAGQTAFEHWHKTFMEHLQAAYELHHIKDVYILEHRDCGAYRKFLGTDGVFNDDEAAEEEACHRKYADQLKAKIDEWATKAGAKLLVKSFLMDLRGRVTPLVSPKKQSASRKPRS
jgi:hypothetical protein